MILVKQLTNLYHIGTINAVPYWNDKCSEAVKERKHAKRKVLRSRLPQDYIVYKRKKALAQKTIKTSKK